MKPILCYVSGNAAYFTTQSLDKQWGDDWDDAPYEHNAGTPYTPCRPDLEDRHIKYPKDWDEYGNPRWTITKVYYDGDFATPDESHLNSPYSVETINKGAIAWLRSPSYGSAKVVIHAGTDLEAFMKLVDEAGGTVYLPQYLQNKSIQPPRPELYRGKMEKKCSQK